MTEQFASPLSTNAFVYDVSDLRAMNRQVLSWWVVLLYLVIFIGVAWFFVSLMLEDGAIHWLLVGILCVLAILYSGAWTWRPLVTYRALRRQGLLVPQTMTLNADQLTVVSDRGGSHLRWAAVKKIRRKGERLFIFASKAVAYIVPARAFDSDEQFEAFEAVALERWKQNSKNFAVD